MLILALVSFVIPLAAQNTSKGSHEERITKLEKEAVRHIAFFVDHSMAFYNATAEPQAMKPFGRSCWKVKNTQQESPDRSLIIYHPNLAGNFAGVDMKTVPCNMRVSFAYLITNAAGQADALRSAGFKLDGKWHFRTHDAGVDDTHPAGWGVHLEVPKLKDVEYLITQAIIFGGCGEE